MKLQKLIEKLSQQPRHEVQYNFNHCKDIIKYDGNKLSPRELKKISRMIEIYSIVLNRD